MQLTEDQYGVKIYNHATVSDTYMQKLYNNYENNLILWNH